MNEIQIFNNEQFGEVRTINKDGEIFFVARDVASALGYAKPETSIRDRVSERDTEKCGVSDANGHTQQMLCVNEAGLYSLIFSSKLESARQFQDWVTHDVLPSIRKTGGYQLPQTTAGQIHLLALGQDEANKRIDKIEAKLDDLPLFPRELETIVKAVKSKAMDIVGGKDSPAYHSCYRMVVRDIYSELWRNFAVNSYRDISRADLPRVPEVIDQYRPPLYLADKIKAA